MMSHWLHILGDFTERNVTRLVLTLIVLFVAVNLNSILTVPAPFCDEPFLASISTNFIREGRFAVTGLDSIAGLDQTNAGAPRLYHIGQGVLLSLLGNTLWTTRFYSVIAWVLALGGVYAIGRELYDKRTGLLASLILASSLHTFMASHFGRQEMWLITGTLGTFLYYLIIRKNPSSIRYLFLGLLMGFTIGLHTNAVWLQAPLSGIIVWQYRRDRASWKYIAATGVGGLLGTTSMVLLQFLPDPRLAWQQYTGILNDLNGLVGSSPLDSLRSEIEFVRKVYITDLNRAVIPFTVMMAVSTLFLALRRSKSDWLVLWMLWGSHLLFAVGMAHKNGNYGSLWVGYAAIAIAAMVVTLGKWITERQGYNSSAFVSLMLLAPLILINLAGQSWLAYKFRLRDLQSYEAGIAELIPPHTRVFGDYSLIYMFDQRNEFISDAYVAYYVLDNHLNYLELTQDDLADIVESLDIDFVVYRGALVCNPSTDAVTEDYHDYLKSACRKVGQVEDRWNGTFAPVSGDVTRVYDCRTP